MAQTRERRVLAVYAHPDDAEIWAGGTLLAHRAAGDRVLICVMTHAQGPRAEEAKQGAEALGVSLQHLAFTDRALSADRTTIEALAQMLRRERPHIILTHWEGDSHPDHVATWLAVRSALLVAEAEHDVQALFWSDTYNGLGTNGIFVPDCLVDVSPWWDAKLTAINAHLSQQPAHYVRMITRQCATHGARAGVHYAEAFRRVPLFGTGQRAAATLWEHL